MPAAAASSVAALVQAHYHALTTGDPALAARVVAPDHVNHMAVDEPPPCAQLGPAGFLATSAWLRAAFSELVFEEIDLVSAGDTVVSHVWMRGVHTGPFVVFPPHRSPTVFPPTGRRFAVRQMHLFRIRDGRTISHIAVRDDLGLMQQLGFVPPQPRSMALMAAWTLLGRARRARAAVQAVAHDAMASHA